ncbi:MAG: 4-hydroxybenzoate octaprenyltransferase [SAR86 cluster bacterium]|uniref:4-hydroxybenzoate octaprenyltransferase n=1 Tax=SAR86 cluster bacterium TaxID=2030880 RepID=A0A2A4MUB8_9GAMM|nr:MAG: 4-hydroxybenzoate octaprenyltransferase [SAR86 cluster bacterium]
MPSLSTELFKLKLLFRKTFPSFYQKIPALLQLTRLDKPIGIGLLLWPTLTSLWIAAQGIPELKTLLIFILGTVIMRSAGCCINDFADADLDGKVDRTQLRPLASGILSRRDALSCFAVLCLLGFSLVLLTNQLTIILSLIAVVVVIIYPFMKRVTNLPQMVLAIAFSFGIIMSFSAQLGEVPAAAFLLFVANCLWTVAYDTQYAMVDREDDIKVGIKSTAILFGEADKLIIATLQALFICALGLASKQFELGLWFKLSLVVACGLLIYQQYLIRDRQASLCFKAFLNNNWVGAIIFTGTVINYL